MAPFHSRTSYDVRVDALAGLLESPRARGAFLLRVVLDPPWSMRVQDGAPLALLAMLRGSAWVTPATGAAREMRAGEVTVVRGPEPYVVADAPETPPQVLIDPGQRCTTLDGRHLADAMDQGVRSWGNSPDGSAVMLVGAYEHVSAVGQRLLRALPDLLVLRTTASAASLISLLGEEIVRDEPGQEIVLDRLLDLLLISVLRTWFARPDANAPAWYRAQGDPVVGSALRLLQNDPARPWSVAGLAAEVGVSRATLARRFTDLVGEPPMTYLTEWRLTLAADLLREPSTTVAAAARQVGYTNPFALSAAYKRVRGASPRHEIPRLHRSVRPTRPRPTR